MVLNKIIIIIKMNFSRGFKQFGKNSFKSSFKSQSSKGSFGFKKFNKINVGMNMHQINMINA
jgi:hypothetical protein